MFPIRNKLITIIVLICFALHLEERAWSFSPWLYATIFQDTWPTIIKERPHKDNKSRIHGSVFRTVARNAGFQARPLSPLCPSIDIRAAPFRKTENCCNLPFLSNVAGTFPMTCRHLSTHLQLHPRTQPLTWPCSTPCI